MSSSRLPGKVMMPILGEPMIFRQLERLARCTTLDKLVVATSEDPSDDALVSGLVEHGIEVRRGALDDVVERFATVIEEFEPQTVVRLTADCPLTDPDVVDTVVVSHEKHLLDYTSNTLEPTYPDGLDVECFSADAFRRMRGTGLLAREREHVTLGMYGRPELFSLNSVTQDVNRAHLRWTVDVEADLEFVREIYAHLYAGDASFGQTSILNLLAKRPELNRTAAHVARNAALEH